MKPLLRSVRPFMPLASALALTAVTACASAPRPMPDQQIAELSAATHGAVSSRAQNQQNSRMLDDLVQTDVLIGLHRHEIAEKLGKGDPCTYHKLCAEQGFQDDDWYYDVGVGDEQQVGKRPVLIIGFGRFGTSERLYNLRVH